MASSANKAGCTDHLAISCRWSFAVNQASAPALSTTRSHATTLIPHSASNTAVTHSAVDAASAKPNRFTAMCGSADSQSISIVGGATGVAVDDMRRGWRHSEALQRGQVDQHRLAPGDFERHGSASSHARVAVPERNRIHWMCDHAGPCASARYRFGYFW